MWPKLLDQLQCDVPGIQISEGKLYHAIMAIHQNMWRLETCTQVLTHVMCNNMLHTFVGPGLLDLWSRSSRDHHMYTDDDGCIDIANDAHVYTYMCLGKHRL